MITLNKMLVYTHKFDKWEYVVLKNPNSQDYSTLSDLESTQKKVLNYVSNTTQETTYYYQNGYYYKIVSTPQDLLQHIPYVPKDNRKHEMNKGFYEYTLPITSNDNIPLELFSLAMQLYIDGKFNCEVNLYNLNCFHPQYCNEYIAKFLYITNELLNLNVYFKASPNDTFKPYTDNKVITFSIVDSIVNKDNIYLTYLKIFEFNSRFSDNIKINNNSIISDTLKFILNAPQDVIKNYLEPIHLFTNNCGISITMENVWKYVDNFSIKNSFSANKILQLPISLNDTISLIINTDNVGFSLFEKYINVINKTSCDSLEKFLNIEENQESLKKVYEILKSIDNKPTCDLTQFINSLDGIKFTKVGILTLIELLKSMCLPKNSLIDILNRVLTNQYVDMLSLSQSNMLTTKSLTSLEIIRSILDFEYILQDFSINLELKKSTQKLYNKTFRKLMNISIISIDNSKKLNFMEKNIIKLNVESFETLTKIFNQLFLVYNKNMNFSKLSEIEKILILCTPNLLLKYIEYCDNSNDEKLLNNLFQNDTSLINIGIVQIQYIKYILYTLLEDNERLTSMVTSLNIQLPIKKYKSYFKRLKKFFESILKIGEIDIK